MAKRLNQVYYFILFLSFLFLCWIQFSKQSSEILAMLDGDNFQPFNSSWMVEKDGVFTQIDQLPEIVSTPGQREIVLINTIPNYQTQDMILSFRTFHQALKVYIDDYLVYKLDASRDPLKKTPGNAWNMLRLDANDQGKAIEIHFFPAYPNQVRRINEFFIGNRLDIVRHEAAASAIPFITCVIILVIGIIDVFQGLTLKTANGINQRFLFLGLFSIVFAILSATERSITMLMFKDSFLFSYVPYIGQLVIPFPMIIYFRESFPNRKNTLIDSALILNLSACLIEILLFFFGIADFHESGLIVQSVFLYAVLVAAIQMIRSFQIQEFSKSHRKWLYYSISILLVFSILIDIFRAYTQAPDDFSLATRFGLMLFLMILGFETEAENQLLMEKGIQMEMVKQMAYRDILTGIRNRMAFKEDLESIDQNDFQNYRLVMMDLNGLKNVNDHFGHSAGDLYIINCAKIISASFAYYGHSYRLSGDEFCCILKNCSNSSYQACVRNLRQESEKITRKSDFPYRIAVGNAKFDASSDKNLMNTLSRADGIMFQNKAKMRKRTEELSSFTQQNDGMD